MSSPRFRRAEPRDLPALLEIERASFKSPWTKEGFEAEIERGSLTVAEVEGEVVGYLVLWDFGAYLYIANVAVKPSWRRQGVGTALVRLAQAEALRLGKLGVSLDVRASNLPARRLYEKLGFRPLRLNPRFYGDEDGFTYLWQTGG